LRIQEAKASCWDAIAAEDGLDARESIGSGQEGECYAQGDTPGPCPGLTELDNAQIAVYIKRTGFVGGGGRSLAVIAMERFDKLFSKLGRKKKKEVMDAQLHEHQWRNEHESCCVFAISCKHVVAEPAPNERTPPCKSCRGLLSNEHFRAILCKPTPEAKNHIYTNHPQ
jgi:hypothetical protein